MNDLPLEVWEERFPEVRWREPVKIAIAPGEPALMVKAGAGQMLFGGTQLLVCRVCIANVGFNAANWEDEDHAFKIHRAPPDPGNVAQRRREDENALLFFHIHMLNEHGILPSS